MRKALTWIGGALALIVVVVTLVIVFFQWSWLRGPLEAKLSSLTGKQVHIDGPITGTKSWVPRIEFNQVRIEDPSFPDASKVGTIGKVAVSIDLGQLLKAKLDFPEISIDRPILNLRRDANGKANWVSAKSSGPGSRSSVPVIGMLKIADGKVSYHDAAKHTEIEGTIATVQATGGSGDDKFALTGHGTYRQAPFTIRLTGDSLNDLRDTKRPYDVDAGASVGATKVTIKGTVTDPFKLTDMNLKLTAQGDNAHDLYPIFGVPAPATPPYHLQGTLDRDGKAWVFKNFDGTVGKSDLAGSLRFDDEGKRIDVTGNLTSRTLDFADLGLLVGAPGSTAPGRPVSEAQRELEKRLEAANRVLPDAPLDLNEVRNVDADVQFKGEHIQAQHLPLEDVDLHLKLDHALMKLDPLRIGVAGGRIGSNITIDARQDTVQTDYDVRFHRFQIAQFFEHAGIAGGGSGIIDGRARLHGTGNSVHESLGTADGEVSAIVDHGSISKLGVDILGLDVDKALGLVITGDTKAQTPLRCMVVDFPVEKGVMTARTLVFDTDAALITGNGTINLADEHLNLSIKGQLKSPGLSLGGPIKIGGTFRKPEIGVGAETIARGGAAVALGALLTPLASVLGFIEPGKGEDADCSALENQATADTAKAPVVAKAQGSPERSPPRRH